ncbi:hypothetical protein PR202_ga11620 [Eleusine coracana subsp. coracana]|uniref:Uncharacterized protein n=1 Tax=Eleusine coracana subsp. coracana TaxID=191504 RepID=A0AAV5CA26_ELECO|nr:hypothetical protein PR202_ga11620 [Eleusine coracana subsp. coracana]
MQGSASSSSSCRVADFGAAWDAEQQQKRQRCQGFSDNQVSSSSENNSLQASEPEFKVDSADNEEEDYYFDDEEDICYDDDDEGSDYEIDTADFNQQLADKFDGLDLPPGVEATVPWLLKDPTEDPGKFKQ